MRGSSWLLIGRGLGKNKRNCPLLWCFADSSQKSGKRSALPYCRQILSSENTVCTIGLVLKGCGTWSLNHSLPAQNIFMWHLPKGFYELFLDSFPCFQLNWNLKIFVVFPKVLIPKHWKKHWQASFYWIDVYAYTELETCQLSEISH